MVVQTPEVLDGLERQDRRLVQLPGPGSVVAVVPERPRVAQRMFAHRVEGRIAGNQGHREGQIETTNWVNLTRFFKFQL